MLDVIHKSIYVAPTPAAKYTGPWYVAIMYVCQRSVSHTQNLYVDVDVVDIVTYYVRVDMEKDRKMIFTLQFWPKKLNKIMRKCGLFSGKSYFRPKAEKQII